jgi:hypothetical protein
MSYKLVERCLGRFWTWQEQRNPSGIGCICLEQSSYWITRLSHQSARTPTPLPHNAFKEAQNATWFVQRSSLLIYGTMNRTSKRRSLDPLLRH